MIMSLNPTRSHVTIVNMPYLPYVAGHIRGSHCKPSPGKPPTTIFLLNPTNMPAINPIAQSGFKNATSYEAHRPSYPPDAVKPFLQHLEVENVLHAHIVDLAAGTGKFTEILARRAEEYEIIAVEPHSGMREVLEKKGLKGVTVMEGTATEMPAVEAQWADAVVVAQVGFA